jgi:hypothetical protein
MESRKTRELTEDEVMIFIKLELMPNVDELFNKLKSTDGGWVLKAIEKRFEAHNIKVDEKVMISVLAIGDGVIGKCVKYVDDIACWANMQYHTEVDWNRYINEIYTFNIPVF